MPTYGLSSTGVTVPRAADSKTEIQDAYRSATGLGDDVDFSGDALLDVFTGVIADRLDALGQLAMALYDGFDPNNATGVQLASLASIVGVVAHPATRSTVTLTFTGTVGTPIPIGTVAQGGGSDETATWQTTEDATIPTSGSVDVVAESVDAGAVMALAGSIDALVTSINGVTTVTNAAAAAMGADEESDEALRIRRALSPALPGAHTRDALVAELLAIPEVTDAVVIDNPDSAAATINGIALSAHSHAIYVLPNPLAGTTQTAVLDALRDNLHFGTRLGVTASFSREETVENTGTTYTVGVAYGTLLTLPVTATLVLDASVSTADVTADLQTAIDAFIAPLRMGAGFTRLQLCGLAAGIEGIVAAGFTINGLDADYSPLANEKVNTVTLTVVVSP